MTIENKDRFKLEGSLKDIMYGAVAILKTDVVDKLNPDAAYELSRFYITTANETSDPNKKGLLILISQAFMETADFMTTSKGGDSNDIIYKIFQDSIASHEAKFHAKHDTETPKEIERNWEKWWINNRLGGKGGPGIG